MKCPTCTQKTNKKWKYCPQCGTKLKLRTQFVKEEAEVHLDKIRYLWERQHSGKFMYENFNSLRIMGKATYLGLHEADFIRPKLSYFTQVYLYGLRLFSFLYFTPKYIQEFYKIGKLIGYYSGSAGVRESGISSIVATLNKAGLFWKVFEKKKVRDMQYIGWINIKADDLNLLEINKKEGKLRFSLKESPTAFENLSKPTCFLETGALAGQTEALFTGLFWDGTEIKCKSKGDDHCEVELHSHKKEEEVKIQNLTKEEIDGIVDRYVNNIITKNPSEREKLGELFPIPVSQVMNYYLISSSPGHAVLSKHSGVLVGEQIAEKACLEGDTAAFDYARDLFLYLKAGILHQQETKGENITLRMDESVYSSGVNNIHMKLDIFLAGIIEGMLNQSTGERWQVEETKCLANGDEHCQFTCRRQNK